jgi:hypothetical protein|tara:strand:- start:266 stop:529 length:264 start_codon:yes stop_codon:yes gene_type:complete
MEIILKLLQELETMTRAFHEYITDNADMIAKRGSGVTPEDIAKALEVITLFQEYAKDQRVKVSTKSLNYAENILGSEVISYLERTSN